MDPNEPTKQMRNHGKHCFLFRVRIGFFLQDGPPSIINPQLYCQLCTYCIPASLDLIMDDLQAIMSVLDSQQGKATTSSKSGKPWSEAKVNDLVNFLYEHWSQSSGGNFKVTTWKGLLTHLEAKYKNSQSISTLKSKFGGVSTILLNKTFHLSNKHTVKEHYLSNRWL